jgi:hypothetical protein
MGTDGKEKTGIRLSHGECVKNHQKNKRKAIDKVWQ